MTSKVLGASVFGCSRCLNLVECRTNIVDGDGPNHAPIMAIGEKPGDVEDRTGRPMAGKSGKLIRDTLAELGAGAALVRYTNATRCAGSNNRTPTKAEIMNCSTWLLAEILEVRPKVLLLMGKIAETSIQLILGEIREELPQVQLVTTRNPAYLLRKPKERDQWKEDLKKAIGIAEAGTFWFDLKEEVEVEEWEIGEPDYSHAFLSIDTETDDGEEHWSAKLVCWQVSDGKKSALFLGRSIEEYRSWASERRLLTRPITFWRAPYDAPLLGIPLWRLDLWEDAELEAYVLRLPVGLKAFSSQNLGLPMVPIQNFIGTGKKRIPASQALADSKEHFDGERFSGYPQDFYEYAILDGIATARDAEWLEKKLKSEPKLERYYREVEKPTAACLLDMEQTGIRVDPEALLKLSLELGFKMKRIAEELKSFGLETPGSTQQLSKLLISMGLELEVNNPETGSWKTDEGTLEKYRVHAVNWKRWEAVEVIDLVLDYRGTQKIKTTYADGLLNARDSGGRIHTHWNQVVTATNRLSSSKPNLQNIPARGEMGELFRKVFIPAEGYTFVCGDYGQLEFRLFANYTQDATMIEAFEKGVDIHSAMSAVIGLPRPIIKTLIYGILYGAEEDKVAQVAGARNKEEAQGILKSIREKVPSLLGWKDQVRGELVEKGYVETMFGWREYYPLFQSPLYSERAAALREACNMPMQGGAGGLAKKAMIASEELRREYGARLLLQVHDELLHEVPIGSEVEFGRKMREIGEGCGGDAISVKLNFDCNSGMNWSEAKGGH